MATDVPYGPPVPDARAVPAEAAGVAVKRRLANGLEQDGVRLDPTRPVTAYVASIYADPDDPACRRRYIRVMIYPDTEQLVAAGHAYDRRRGYSDQDLTGSAGLFQPAPLRSRYDRRKRQWIDTTTPFAGVMRLARGWLTGEFIAHESAHAALRLWRLHQWSKPGQEPTADLGEHYDAREEAFCHLLSGITGSVNDIVRRYREATGDDQ